jgi:hypothetical protein
MVTELQVSASSFNKERKGCIGGTDGRQHGVLRVELFGRHCRQGVGKGWKSAFITTGVWVN